jgi:hypothetical protein
MNGRLFVVVSLGFLAGCWAPRAVDTSDDVGSDGALARVGDTCADSSSCNPGLECVVTFSDANTCLPQPRERAVRSCQIDDDCRRSDGEQWPIESDCLDGACHCNDADKSCDDDCLTDDDCPVGPTGKHFLCGSGRCIDSEGRPLVLDGATCLCVQLGGVGDRCTSAATCAQEFPNDLACSDGRCVSHAPAGASCLLNGGAACAGSCVGTGEDRLGVCQDP